MSLENMIIEWANDRHLYENSTTSAQIGKLYEEIEEVKEAIESGDEKEIKLELGDCYVVLVNLAKRLGFSLHGCGIAAYLKIKDRTGKMENGTFVKDLK
jgi:NTP pyrophosphatase (non-canonical NTP hydrolase)